MDYGEVWNTTEGVWVVVMDKAEQVDEVVRVAPVSTETEQASEYDLIVRQPNHPLDSKAVMIELWNEQPTLPQMLCVCLGKLSTIARQQLACLFEDMWKGTVLKGRHRELIGEVSVDKIDRGTELTSENDPRHEFQKEELKRTAFLRESANSLL